MKISIELQNPNHFKRLPDKQLLKRVLVGVLTKVGYLSTSEINVTIRFVGTAESKRLNCDYRQIDKPTNVLSFENFAIPGYLGDLVLCVPVVRLEAKEQLKVLQDHFVHLVVHGLLHLLGYDHCQEPERLAMEKLEIAILNDFKIANPYE